MSDWETVREIIEALMAMPSPTHGDVNRVKLEVAAKHHLQQFPSNPDIIAALKPEEKPKLQPILCRKVPNHLRRHCCGSHD
jgi:histone acetyltransferase (RNA polymerase elongator complex component)